MERYVPFTVEILADFLNPGALNKDQGKYLLLL